MKTLTERLDEEFIEKFFCSFSFEHKMIMQRTLIDIYNKFEQDLAKEEIEKQKVLKEYDKRRTTYAKEVLTKISQSLSDKETGENKQ